MKELPYRLRIQLAVKIHKRIVENVPFLNKRSSDFIAFVGPMLKTLRFKEGSLIYTSQEPVLESKRWSASERCSFLPDGGACSVRAASQPGEHPVRDNRGWRRVRHN